MEVKENTVLTEELLEEYGFKRLSDKNIKEYIYTNDIYVVNLLFIETDNKIKISLFNIYTDRYISKIYIHLTELTLSILQKVFDLFGLKLEKPIEFWVARDNNNNLYLYSEKPIICRLTKNYYTEDIHKSFKINNDLFPNITYKDKPKKVLLKLVE